MQQCSSRLSFYTPFKSDQTKADGKAALSPAPTALSKAVFTNVMRFSKALSCSSLKISTDGKCSISLATR